MTGNHSLGHASTGRLWSARITFLKQSCVALAVHELHHLARCGGAAAAIRPSRGQEPPVLACVLLQHARTSI